MKPTTGLRTLLLAVLGFGLAPAVAGDLPRKPLNVILISVDTLRADALGCYGNRAAATPAIDALAASGVLFERAFAHTPLTLPSHTNILSGTLPVVHGVHDNLGFRVPDRAVMLAEHLKSQGLRTAAFVGAYPLDSSFGLDQGFDLYDDFYGSKNRSSGLLFVERPAGETVARAVDWIGRQTKEGWFVFLHLFDPHQPYAPPEPYAGRYASDPYGGEVAYVDHCLAGLVQALTGKGLAGSTLIVLTADHGEAFGEHGESTHGYFAYNSTLHVPLIISGPGVTRPGTRLGNAVSHVDIYPTVCGLLGIPAPDGLQGRSLAPLIGGRPLRDGPIYFECLAPFYNNGWAPLRGVVDKGFKYIDAPLPELYGLEADFREKVNLAPTSSLGPFRSALDKFVAAAPGGPMPRPQAVPAEAREKLRSLGYLGGAAQAGKARFTAADDLKTNLPFQQQLMRASELMGRGDETAAILELEDLVRKKGDLAAASEFLSIVLSGRGERDKAVTVLRAAVERSPASGRLRGLLGLALSQNGADTEAVPELERAVDANPEDAEAWNNLGVALWKSGRFGPAEESYLKALALDATGADILNNLGALAMSRKEWAGARGFFERALAYDPGLASAWNGLGAALAAQGDLAGAVGNWRKAVAAQPDHELALFNLGTGLLKLGRPDEALPFLERYLEVAPAASPDRARVARAVDAIKGRRGGAG